MLSLTWLMGLAIVGLLPAEVSAQGWEWVRGERTRGVMPHDRGAVGAELGVFAGDSGTEEHLLLLSPRIGGFYRIASNFELSLDWTVAYFRARSVQTDRTVRPSNVATTATYVETGSALRVQFGLGLALPIAVLPEDPGDRALAVRTHRVAPGLRGAWDPWLWMPETLTLFVPARFESAPRVPLLLGVEGALGLAFDINADAVDALSQLALDVGYRGEVVSCSLRTEVVWRMTGEDFAQVALVPFVRLDLGKPFFLGRITINLDDPYGFAFENNAGMWGIDIGGGSAF